jgi:hypothetical protein
VKNGQASGRPTGARERDYDWIILKPIRHLKKHVSHPSGPSNRGSHKGQTQAKQDTKSREKEFAFCRAAKDTPKSNYDRS